MSKFVLNERHLLENNVSKQETIVVNKLTVIYTFSSINNENG